MNLVRLDRMTVRFALALMVLLARPCGRLMADDATVDFAVNIYPVLRRACFECHGQEKQEGELRLDRRDDLVDSGTIVPGDPEDSELLRRISLPRGHDEVMPAIGEPLPKRRIAIIRRWIAQGANWPADFVPDRHWAYVAPKRPKPPEPADQSWGKTEIDRFVLHRLDETGLTPSPPAAPETLIRRVYLDLVGLPPTPEEVDSFAADPSDAAYEQLVDALLLSPQFGEKWARPWLDLARYADSHGFQRDNLREIWAYRDWVIRALNADMPFDQFTIEQIAGDLLPGATESQKIATGFHRCAPTNVEAGSLPEETRVEQVIDRVNTTGAVWLGTTLECAQCHDHKYDPITMKDYYRLLAFYNNTEREADRTNPKTPSSIAFRGPSMPLSDPTRDAQRENLSLQLAALQKQRESRKRELMTSLSDWAHQQADRLRDAPKTHPLEIVAFESEGTTDSFERKDDGSILLVGDDPPATDVYTIAARTNLSNIGAFRLDVLTDSSLPGMGPGRGDAKRTNFVLNEISVSYRPESNEANSADVQPVRLEFIAARADFAQTNWDPIGAVDGKPKTGWAIAPQFGKPHWAIFTLAKPLDAHAGGELLFRMEQNWGGARTIGRFRISAITGNVDAESVPAEIAAAFGKSPDQWTRDERRKLIDYRQKHDAITTDLNDRIAATERQIKQLAPATTLVMVEIDKPRPSYLFERGDYRKQGESLQPGTPDALHALTHEPANRLTLARWLVDPNNPLVARVTVNRWWAELFGRGIVTTVEDFGLKGEPPTHPLLLDWLAVEFMENGWSMKRLLKTIVLSSTYRQSSKVTRELHERDDQNRWLARGPRFRMNAEMIRDNALAISGLLSLKQFGPPIRPYQPPGIWTKVGGTAYDYAVSPGDEQYRRGLYVVLKRGAPYPSFVNFDATARLACTVRRSRTNTPLQALTLLNDPVYVDAAKSLAGRMMDLTSDASLEDRLEYGFRLCTARRPSAAEKRILTELYQKQLNAVAHAKSGRAEPVTAEQAAWYGVATAMLNLHETITKE